MNQDRLVGIEQRQRLLDATTCFEQRTGFVADTDIQTKVMIFLKIGYNLIGKVVNITTMRS